jgi:secreted trypsin-like serine protease
MFVRNILLLVSIVGSLSAQNLILNIRDNGKICTSWMNTGAGSVSYQQNRECSSGVSWDYNAGRTQARLCCQGIPLTTVAPNFPRQCGKQLYTPLGQRIIGGSVAQPHSWPWQVLVTGPSNMCGGSLIDERHVITAAHCIKSIQEPYTVTVGLHDRNGVTYMEQIINVEKIYVHEQYDKAAITNDVAILYLSKSVQVTDKVNFICLPGAEANIGAKVYASGWGKTSGTGDTSAVLKQTDLTVTNCSRFWAPSQADAKKQICAVASGSGACSGDSGGPLMYQYNGQWYLNGIVSFVESSCNTNLGVVFARVSYYLPWFKAKMALAKTG